MQDFRNLRVWQASRQLTVAVSAAVRRFPIEERFGLAAQLRSSVTSIGANIAEGFGRGSRADSARCLQIAVGSGCETLHHLITALDLGYLNQAEFDELEGKLGPVRRMLTNLLFRVRPKQVERQSVPKARPRT
jgi:four helix bundle protein